MIIVMQCTCETCVDPDKILILKELYYNSLY